MAGRKTDGVEFGRFKAPDGSPSEGREVVAYSQEEAVTYRFNGWIEVQPPAAENQPDQQ